MKIESWISPLEQQSRLGRHVWSVARLFKLSENLPVMEVPLNHLNVYYTYEKMKLRDMVSHIKAVNEADLEMPIILDEDGEVMDGRHRIMKAMLLGKETIKAVRFDENPYPCKILDE